MRGWVRVVMVVVGFGVFLVYALAAAAGYLVVTWLLADPPNLFVALGLLGVFTLIAAYVSYRFGTARMLANLDAVELPYGRASELYRRLDRLCGVMDVSPPRLVVGNLGAPNALSLGGPRKGVVVIDRRLLSLLTIDELEGIVAHELAHLERYDAFVRTLAVSLMRTFVGLVVLLLLPVLLVVDGIGRTAAWMRGRPRERHSGVTARARQSVDVLVGTLLGVLTLLLLAHSRRREFAADERAAEATGKPVALARALAKIHRASTPDWGLRSVLYIHSDEQAADSLRRLLSTHPPIEDRIDRLVERAEPSTGTQYLGRLRP